MSEALATNRALSGSEEFERRVRAMAAASPAPNDPLAELARLVGQDDPFRGVAAKPQPTIPSRPRAPDHADFAAFDDVFAGAPDAGEEPGTPDDPAVVHGDVQRPAPPAARPVVGAERTPTISVRGERAPDISADAWALGAAPAALTATREAQPATAAAPGEASGSSRRTMIVLAAVVALTGGGLAASFLAKPTAGSTAVTAASAGTAPTILAATGPTKVQPETPANNPDAPSEPSTLLDKNKNDGTASARVVNSVEQPVDLSQAVKPAPVSQTPADDVASSEPSAFPAPRRVRTVVVRPDGTMIASSQAPVAADPVPTSTAGQQASLAFDPRTSLPIVSSTPAASPAPADPVAAATPPETPAAATPAPPKSQARVGTTPKPSATGTETRVTGTLPKVRPGAKPPAADKPVQAASATPPAAAEASPAPGGKFGVQLGAGGTEAEAQGIATRLGRKYGLDAAPSVHKAQVGDKTVYRVRVGGLSQEAAKAMCGKVTGAGGGCFVVRD